MKKWTITAMVVLCTILIGCTTKEEDSSKISYEYDKDNILGLTQITQTQEELVLVFDIGVAKKEECLTASFDTMWGNPTFDGPVIRGEENSLIEIISSDAYKKRGKMYVEIQCQNADTVNYIVIRDVKIQNFAAPELEIEIQGGEIICFLRQKYDADKQKWKASEYEEVFFPIEEG